MFNVTRATAGLNVIAGAFAGEPYTPVDPGVAAAQAQLQTAYSAGISDAGAVRGCRSARASILFYPYPTLYPMNATARSPDRACGQVPLAVVRDALSTLGTEFRARTACGARLVLRADVAPSASAHPAEARAPQQLHAGLAGPLTAAAALAGKSCMFCACGTLTNATIPYIEWKLTSAGALPAPLEPADLSATHAGRHCTLFLARRVLRSRR